MAEIILARHGETDWNMAEIFRGRIDIGLNETGIRQAGFLAEHLSNRSIDAVYSSPLTRALKTAEAIAGCKKLSVEIAPGLIDFDFGEWQGLAHQEVKDRYPDLYAEWISHPEQVKIPGGESLDEVRERALNVIDKVRDKYGDVVVVVSHRVVNKVLICALLGLDNSRFWNIRQDTCGITVFTYTKGQYILTGHNDTSYLKSMSRSESSDF